MHEMALRLSTVVSDVGPSYSGKPRFRFRIRSVAATVRNMAFSATFKAGRFPYSPGQEPTSRKCRVFALEFGAVSLSACMEEAGVDGALSVQPINHKFDHSVMSQRMFNNFSTHLIILKKYPTKFVGCCLTNPADDGSGLKQFEDLVLKDGYRAVRFNPYLWPPREKVGNPFLSHTFVLSVHDLGADGRISSKGRPLGLFISVLFLQMTNKVGKEIFQRAGELNVPVGFMCMKGLDLHISEIEQLCTEFPSTVVLLDHLGFCKPPINDEEGLVFSQLLNLSRFPQEHQLKYYLVNKTSKMKKDVHVKFSALFRVSRAQFPYLDLSPLLSQVVSHFGANRVMWGSDFPFVVAECGYKGAKEAMHLIAKEISFPLADLE
ncbi:hypothetical protein HKD37_02G003779 [Glycine soja]